MKIWLTRYNADMTEGRGPMVNGPAFLHQEHAAEYIDAQPGVMGRRAKWSSERYGDWCLQCMEVHETSLIDAEKEREALRAKALSKLTTLEREALGLKST